MRRTMVLLTAMAVALFAFAGAALAETPPGKPDANDLPGDANRNNADAWQLLERYQLGQTFTAAHNGELTSVQAMAAWYTGTRHDVVMKIAAVDDQGRPGTVLATTQIPAAEVPSLRDDVLGKNPSTVPLLTGHFSNPVKVTEGQRYAIILERTFDDGADAWVVNTVEDYAGGDPWSLDDGDTTWLPVAGYPGWNLPIAYPDLIFATYITYDWTGFVGPVDNPDVATNKAKAGSAIPVKFSLGGNQGLNIFATGTNPTTNEPFTYPTSTGKACDSTAQLDAIEETVTAGGNSLQYDASLDQYTYVWKTDKAWAGSCRQLVVKLDDGTYHRANFQFVK
jgi:hypothetical protein